MPHRIRWWIPALCILAGCAKAAVTPAVGAAPTDTSRATPPAAALAITKYPGNYTCFKIVTSRNVVIVTDPFGMTEDVAADIVTVSHDHSDHNDLRHIQPPLDPLHLPGEYTVRGIRITGVAGRHNKGDTGTTNVIFVFDLDGIRLAQFASQGAMPTAEMFAAIGKADILILQIYGGPDKISVDEAVGIARTLEAKIVIPAHTDTAQTAVFAEALGASDERIESGTLEVTAAGLAAQERTKVLTLDTA